MFGKYSYVLDPENSNLWRSLIGQSLTLFGHSAIHETVYERLTDEDVDYMIRHNVRLGQSFNSFYDSSVFASGAVDTVLNTITSVSYNVLETKLQHGINRYISEMTSGYTAGTWLGTVFSVDALKEKTDIASIISDTTLWTDIIMENESLRYVICLSTSTIDWFANNESDVYIDFINEVCNSTKATTDLFTAITGADKLTTFMDNEYVFSVVASKTESMIAITYMTAPFAAMIASETAMNIVANSDVAMSVIVDSLSNVANSENVLDTIKKNLSSIESSLPSIANSDTNIEEVADVKTHISDVILSLQKTTTQTDILISNITNLFSSTTAMTAIVNNSSVLTAIANNDKARVLFESSSEAVNAMNTMVDSNSSVSSVDNKDVYVSTDSNTNPVNNIVYSGLVWIKSISNGSANNYQTFYVDTISSGRLGPYYAWNMGTKMINKFANDYVIAMTASNGSYIRQRLKISYNAIT